MHYFCGIDIGASAAKLVLIDGDGQVVGQGRAPLGRRLRRRPPRRCLRRGPRPPAGLDESQIAGAVSTGYGRDNVPWAARQDDRDRLPRQGRLPPLPPAR